MAGIFAIAVAFLESSSWINYLPKYFILLSRSDVSHYWDWTSNSLFTEILAVCVLYVGFLFRFFSKSSKYGTLKSEPTTVVSVPSWKLLVATSIPNGSLLKLDRPLFVLLTDFFKIFHLFQSVSIRLSGQFKKKKENISSMYGNGYIQGSKHSFKNPVVQSAHTRILLFSFFLIYSWSWPLRICKRTNWEFLIMFLC